MQRILLGFCCGALILALPWPVLPPLLPLAAGAIGALAIALAMKARLSLERPRQPQTLRSFQAGCTTAWSAACLSAGAMVGLLWSALAHHDALASRLMDRPGGDAVPVAVRVVSDPVTASAAPGRGPALRFQAEIVNPDGTAGPFPDGRVVRLSWHDAPPVLRGDQWALRAVIRGPWSYANPAGFDYERWLLGSGIHGTGYVRSGTLQSRSRAAPLNRLRLHLEDALRGSGLERRGILAALLTGQGGSIPDGQWETFRITGTVHLMVISGLHIGLAAGLGFLVGRWALVMCPALALRLDARKAGALAGVTLAAGYVGLSGAGLPAVRALIMAAGVLALVGWGRNVAVGGTLIVALAGILLLDPLAVHRQGFWLSFGAVAILMLTMSGRPGRIGRLEGLLRPQLALSLGMLPLVALHTGDVPWAGIPANLVAVPVVSLCVVPAVLLGGALTAVWPAAAAGAFWFADASLAVVLAWLSLLARAPQLPGAGAAGPLLMAQAAALWWLLDPPRRHLPVLALCFMLPLAPLRPDIAEGEYRIMALDVGQGAATVVDTRSHRLLFDAGPGFPGGFETGSTVVVPSLLATGIRIVDVMVLSHDHLDHTGGAAAILAALEVRRLLTAFPGEEARSCHGRQWRWDGVSFRLLRLARPAGATENDRSCVLVVDDGRHRTLLAGDIGARVERVLLRKLLGESDGCAGAGAAASEGDAECRDATLHLMFAPHHGSATSSSAALVRALAPKLVFVNAGRNNRFGHPHPRVVERYRRVDARMYQTGRHGALVWWSRHPDRVVRWRVERAPYWRARETAP